MEALVLAAGYGRRLYPLTKDYPKPLLKVKDKPIIDYIIPKLEKPKEIKKIWIITNNKFFSHFKRWKKNLNFKKPVELINDLTSSYTQRLGALADIKFAIEKRKIKDDLLIIGGDNLFDEGLEGFISCIKKKKKNFVVGLYFLKDKSYAKNYGVVRINQEGKIIDFEEKPRFPKSNLICMCLYYFPKDKFFLLDEYLKDKKNLSDATGNFIMWLYSKQEVYAYIFRGIWYDIGGYKFLKEANRLFNLKESTILK
jgi:glucose-1-phosphate thymidylyltransferase